jgi:hypothetical protein
MLFPKPIMRVPLIFWGVPRARFPKILSDGKLLMSKYTKIPALNLIRIGNVTDTR